MSINYLQQVKSSTAQVLKHSQYVKINTKKLVLFAENLPIANFQHLSYTEPFHFCGDEASTLKYIVLLDTLNFGSGYLLQGQLKEGIYQHVAAALKNLLENQPDFSAQDLVNINAAQLSDILAVNADFPLLPAYQNCWQALGHYLIKQHDGNFMSLFSHCQHNAARLIQELADNLQCFADITDYQGEKIFFLKKAQCLVADSWLALQGQGLGHFIDIGELTTFADNVIPQMLWAQGILDYAPILAEKIRYRQLFKANSQQEVEIRAAAVQAVEKIRQHLATQGNEVLSIQIDWYLWNLGQTKDYQCLPTHLTETIYY